MKPLTCHLNHRQSCQCHVTGPKPYSSFSDFLLPLLICHSSPKLCRTYFSPTVAMHSAKKKREQYLRQRLSDPGDRQRHLRQPTAISFTRHANDGDASALLLHICVSVSKQTTRIVLESRPRARQDARRAARQHDSPSAVHLRSSDLPAFSAAWRE